MLTLIIHLKSAKHRHDNVAVLERDLRPMSAELEVTPAVVGNELTEAEIDQVYVQGLHKPRYPFALNKGEVGCFLSHRAAWQRLIDSDHETALIIEDDACVTVSILSLALSMAEARLPEFDFIQLQTRGPKRLRIQEPMFLQPHVPQLRTTGQILNRKAASRLLEATQNFDRPVDTFLQMRWLTGLAMPCIYTSGVEEANSSVSESTLGASRGLKIAVRKPMVQKIRRALARSLYRRRLKSALMIKSLS